MIPEILPVQMHLALRIRSEANLRQHWSVSHKRAAEQRGLARLALQSRLASLRGQLPFPLVVGLIRIAPRELDGDNLQRGLKAVRDGVADALGIDDRDKRVTWAYAQARGMAKQYAVRIVVARRLPLEQAKEAS